MKKSLMVLMLLMGVMAGIVQASESAPTREEVAKLYVATFDRAPDAAGLSYWVEKSGLTLSQIARSFFDQPETKERYPKKTAPAVFVKSVYENLFGREPDTAGLEYWVGELKNGHIDKSRFIEAVINGALGDDAKILANKTAVGLAFAQQGLQDLAQAEAVMEGVDASEESVHYIVEKIQSGNLGDDPWAGYTPFAFLSPDSNVTVPENGKAAFTIRASHPEGTMVYYTLGGKDRRAFDVDGKRGTVTFKKAPDFERKKLYEVMAVAVLYSVESSTQRPKKEARAQRRIEKPVAVHIENVPEKPTLALFRKAMHMDQSPGEVVGKARVLNSGDGKIGSWSLIGTRDFHILRNGVIINTTPFDFDKDTTLAFKIRVENSAGQVGVQNALVTLVKDNTPPVAFDQNVTVNKNSISNPIELNATDEEDDSLTYIIITQPEHGELNGTAPHLTYTPIEDYVGEDSFTFKVNDGREDSEIAKVSITVKDVCNIGYYDLSLNSGNPDQVAPIETSGNTALNVGDLSSADLSQYQILFVQNPSNFGYASTYRNNMDKIADFVSNGGVLIFHDRRVTEAASILPGSENTVYKRNFYDSFNTEILLEGTPLTNGSGGILTSDSLDNGNASHQGYIDATTVPMNAVGLLSRTDPLQWVTYQYPYGNGYVIYSTIPLDYYLRYHRDSNFSSIYAPNIIDYAETLSSCAPNHPPVAHDQNVTVQTNSTDNPIELNATDADGDPLSYQIVEAPSHGTLGGIAPHLTYTPDANYTGEDRFSYLANDGKDDSNIATVQIEITSTSNVALHKYVTAYSNVVEGDPQNITDGSDDTWWYSWGGIYSTIEFVIDLGGEFSIERYHFHPLQTRDYTIETSLDGDDWTVRHEVDGLIDSPVQEINETESYKARYIRYTGHNNDNAYVGMTEFEVYGH